MDRVILHCDCNSFFASVETALNPAYRDVPMAVCGDPDSRHGIVLAKNELAKKYGISTTDTVYQAKRACPDLVIVKPHYDEYIKYSRRVNEIYAEYTDLVEPFGIDESWLDVTASRRLFGSGYEIAEQIRERVKHEVGITVSIGVSFDKVFSKLGSDYKKPDAITVINRENLESIAYPLPVGNLLFVGKKTEEVLHSVGIRTIGDLASAQEALLSLKLGKSGVMLSRFARGLDDSPVLPIDHEDDLKSVGNGFTFKHDLIAGEDVKMGIDYLSYEIGRRLRNKGLLASTISVAIKDEFMKVYQKQRGIYPPTDIGEEIAAMAYEITRGFWSPGKPIRTITVTAQNLIKNDSASMQLDLFSSGEDEEAREKKRKMEETIDEIRRKYGSSSVIRGSTIDNDIGIYDPKASK